jgi:hypothetical protein
MKVKLLAKVAYKSMNRVQHLAQANQHLAELAVQILHQRVIVKYALDTGQRSEMAESLLDALEGSLRMFERHQIFLLSCSADRPSKGRAPKRPDRKKMAPTRSNQSSGLFRPLPHSDLKVSAAAVDDESCQDNEKHTCGGDRSPVIFAPPRVRPPAVVATRTTSIFKVWVLYHFRAPR